ncbi:DUF4260 domain-containing protein [Microbacterium sp. MPKO10]|uniref:DUF4260 domain-containing protein n=1 Tax=Microbacterium sp. MPKO10 TaxID=2989818 RepID=UPI0022358653|nr:DUF4260 domain-containing protein [Microbacterium sp. MPKO10]MCW4458492.1 DUF4260 domain-containing protein [Microbacterium sp. MPKO10]
MKQVRMVHRIEAGAIALLAVVAVVALYPAWWWVILAAFVVFDLSMLGYAWSAAAGATTYNLIHNYAWALVLAATALVTQQLAPAVSTITGVLACAWAFHVGVDRALGFGVKIPDAFGHTDLGEAGNSAASAGERRQPERQNPGK